MAFFGITVETIESVSKHPDPEVERLEVAKCVGLSFQFVVQKGIYQPGSKVAYFPLDSLLPDALIEKLGMVGKFSGAGKNVVKTLRLRGVLAQGFVAPAEEVLPPELMLSTPEKITEFLGVIKYVPTEVDMKNAIGAGLPSGFGAYDIEGADRNQDIIDLLLDQDVVVLEKMEGENSSYGKVLDEKFVSCRERSLIEKEGCNNMFWDIARTNNLLPLMDKFPASSAMLYGELCGPGIHGNHYKLKHKQIFLFDLRVGDHRDWLCFDEFESFLKTNQMEQLMAPVIYKGKLRDFLAGRSIQEASNGMSLLNKDVLMEGIVVKPLKEQTHPKLGRLIIKQRSPQYLAKTGR